MMSDARDVVVLVGSLRKESFSLKTAHALATLARPALQLEVLSIGQLSFFNQDYEATPPPEWVEFKHRIKAAGAVLFVTPEYNRSVPGVLKNAIDVASRPYGQSAWDGKPGAVISVTPGALGAFGANHHLRQSLVFLNVLTMQQPEAYISNAATLFDDKGTLVNEATAKFLTTFARRFAEWIDRCNRRP
jgi:chromate reductase